MTYVKNMMCMSALALLLTACGGGSETSVSFDAPPSPPAVSESEYDRQTKAAQDQFAARLATSLAESETWMDNNRREAGVVTTQSGLQYKVNTSTPNPNGLGYTGDQTVTVHYEGKLTDGRIFDSSYDRGRPESLKPSELIEGWKEVLTLMKPGDQWTVFMPPSLAYGAEGKGDAVPPNAVLVFEIDLR